MRLIRIADTESRHPKTIKQVNDYLHKKGVPLDVSLRKGDGYFYFSGDSVDSLYDRSVYVYKLSDMTLDEWFNEYNYLKNGKRQ